MAPRPVAGRDRTAARAGRLVWAVARAAAAVALPWRVRGPLVARGCLAAVAGPVRGAEPDVVGLLWPPAVGAGTTWWAGVTARRTVRGR